MKRISLLIGALLLAGCADSGGPDTSSPPPTDAPPPLIADGKHGALVSDVTGAIMTFDLAEFLTGDAAVAAALADGAIDAGDDLPNSFYIRNPRVETATIPLGVNARCTLLRFDEGGSPVATAGRCDVLAGLFAGEVSPDDYYGFAVDAFPMVLTIFNGEIVAADQAYVP